MNDTTKPETMAVAEAVRVKLAPVNDESEFAMLLDSGRFAQIQRVANLFAESTLVPDTFQGKPANCAVALQMAFRMRIDPMMLMQNIHVVHGKPGLDGKMAIALINSRGPFTGPLQWKFEGAGETRKCTVYAKHRTTNEVCELSLDWSTVKGEGWDSNKKWKTMQDQMFRYRTASWFGRAYCPEVLMGLPTDDELQDVGERVVSGERLVDQEVIGMPVARSDAPAEQHEKVDTETGEIIEGEKATPEPQQASLVDEPMAEAKPEPTTQRVASEAQRKVILARAAARQMTDRELDAALGERFAFTLATMPAAMVNDVLGFLQGK